MGEQNFVVWATSSPTGLNIIGRKYKDSICICDLYTMKMVMNPETGERYFSFAPLNPLAKNQVMSWENFKELANRGVHCGYYQPATPAVRAYLEFVDSEERKEHMAMYYLEECGPSKEWIEKNEKTRSESSGTAKTTTQGKVIKGAFACVEEE